MTEPTDVGRRYNGDGRAMTKLVERPVALVAEEDVVVLHTISVQ